MDDGDSSEEEENEPEDLIELSEGSFSADERLEGIQVQHLIERTAGNLLVPAEAKGEDLISLEDFVEVGPDPNLYSRGAEGLEAILRDLEDLTFGESDLTKKRLGLSTINMAHICRYTD